MPVLLFVKIKGQPSLLLLAWGSNICPKIVHTWKLSSSLKCHCNKICTGKEYECWPLSSYIIRDNIPKLFKYFFHFDIMIIVSDFDDFKEGRMREPILSAGKSLAHTKGLKNSSTHLCFGPTQFTLVICLLWLSTSTSLDLCPLICEMGIMIYIYNAVNVTWVMTPCKTPCILHINQC